MISDHLSSQNSMKYVYRNERRERDRKEKKESPMEEVRE
jgi:hypothetical protein